MGEYLKGYEVGFAVGLAAASLSKKEQSMACNHDWQEVYSQSDNAMKCKNCGMYGERQRNGDVYWPAT